MTVDVWISLRLVTGGDGASDYVPEMPTTSTTLSDTHFEITCVKVFSAHVDVQIVDSFVKLTTTNKTQ